MADDEKGSKSEGAVSHWVNVVQSAHQRIRGQMAADHQAKINTLAEQLESELAPVLAPFLTEVLANPDVPENVRELLAPLVEPTQLGQSLILGIAVGAVLSPVLGAALAPAVQIVANAVWPLNQVMPLSGAELAAAVLKGVISLDEGIGTARLVGYDAHNFQLLTEIAGQAIGIEQAILLWRRGDIDDTELARVVHYSNVRSDFLPDIEKLKYLPLSTGEVVAANIKGHLDDTTAATWLGYAGIDPQHQPLLKAAAGRPLGLQEMYTVLHRGGASQQDIDDTVRQSDVNDHWLPFVPYLKWHYPPLFQVERAVKAGSMTPARATQILGYEGYEPQDIAAVVTAAQGTTSTTAKELTAAQVVRMYEARLITQPDALTRLEALRFDAGDAQLLLDYADNARRETYVNAVLARVRAKYVAHGLSDLDATNILLQDGIPQAAVTEYLHLWALERGANVHVLTPAAVVGAYRRDEIDAKETHDRLIRLGVQPADLAIVVADGWPPTKPPAAALVAAVVNAT